jgi:hypothetical protein
LPKGFSPTSLNVDQLLLFASVLTHNTTSL